MASAKQMLIKHNEKDVNVEGIILLGEYPPEFSTYDDTMREKTIESFKVQGIKLMTYGVPSLIRLVVSIVSILKNRIN